METIEIQQAIEAALPEAQVYLEGEGCNFSAIVVSEAFHGLPLVKRQQKVLAPVTPWLASGALHAFSVKTYTAAEWDNRQAAAAGGLVQIQG
ncbi:MAG: BolA/IbaG family iron-sulfur metabolism protein [Proteobacteria bacterium]|nr:BolA/IbaG family iron-sulfur metabolism protein [Pseudomonadota bacterium]